MISAHVLYSGMVQGVGFRYTVQRLAEELKLAGRVKNLPDGKVEVFIEGPKDTVEALLGRIETRFEHNIRHKSVDFQKTQGHFKDFQITF